MVDKIELAVKEKQDEPWAVTDVLDYEDVVIGGGDPFIAPYVYRWRKYTPQFTLSDDEANKFSDTIPFNCQALTVSKNRLLIGNITEDTKNQQSLKTRFINISWKPSSNSRRKVGHTSFDMDQPEDTRFGVMFKDQYGRTNGISLIPQVNHKIFNTIDSQINLYDTQIPDQMNLSLKVQSVPTWALELDFVQDRSFEERKVSTDLNTPLW